MVRFWVDLKAEPAGFIRVEGRGQCDGQSRRFSGRRAGASTGGLLGPQPLGTGDREVLEV